MPSLNFTPEKTSLGAKMKPPPQGSTASFKESTVEKIRREEEIPQIVQQQPLYANPAPAPSGPAVPDPLTIVDRFHKKGRVYITVSPQHFSGDDPVDDPAAYHTITEGYAAAKALRARMTDPLERVVIEVHGGEYNETLLLDTSNIDIVAIGIVVINGQLILADTVTSAYHSLLYVINPDSTPEQNPREQAGLIALHGADSGAHQSDVIFEDCTFVGPNQQWFIERWMLFVNCVTRSTNNRTSLVPSAEFRFQLYSDGSVLRHWSMLIGCRFYAEGAIAPAGIPPLMVPNYFEKGCAVRIIAQDDAGNWQPNILSGNSGILSIDCLFSGYTENYGWNWQFEHCKHIEGKILNTTSGSYHHVMYCTDTITPSSWFSHCRFNVRYIACLINTRLFPQLPNPSGTCNLRLLHAEHLGVDHCQPPLVAGSDVILNGNLVPPVFGGISPTGNVFCDSYCTGANLFFEIAGLEAATLSANCFAAQPVGIYTDFYEDL